MIGKAAIILGGYIASYVALVFFCSNLWLAIALGFVLSQFYVMVGFGIQHDGTHESFSRHKWVNRLAGMGLDFLGASSTMWKYRHNFVHHTYTNIAHVDDDLETLNILRLSPHHDWKPWHRFQHLYCFLVYGILAVFWIYVSDFQKLQSGKLGKYNIPDFSVADKVVLFGGRILFISYSMILPSFFHPFWQVVVANALILMVVGINLSLVFNLAHVTGDNEYPQPENGEIENEWAIHQVVTAANFAAHNPWVSWYTGGLNCQIEHHLFPTICHIHYPRLCKIVEQTCGEFGVPYVSYPTVMEALACHLQFLKDLGQPDSVASVPMAVPVDVVGR
ncbi:fatty acid desaturase family protein [Prochlorothrix hollandica]|nr:acyl-CoA desaturase [Prochlorothrix hollandica]